MCGVVSLPYTVHVAMYVQYVPESVCVRVDPGGGGFWGLSPPPWPRSVICFHSKLFSSVHPTGRNDLNHLNNFRGAGVSLIESGVAAQGSKKVGLDDVCPSVCLSFLQAPSPPVT